ncbi:DNA primase DnaG [Halalkalicoccus paucihalophilus]|uniref:DNA primase DnaG n=1 Tax=Halalkalicoccus paucihalophilus TaxID=1008153 RepID=A0A151AFL3_9EURY|nr:DNA primase DnaG [Halalkalicoccus paucihalophilus]KYH26380.1 DNA primase DnaG [Halalkalicoccus paucihalophilus]
MTLNDTAKYLIHADITADGVVERSDVVGAVFGQTEGLLGDDLEIHDLQQSSKVGRIDVEIASQRGQSAGTITVASSMDKVETAVLAAALETIDRVGPCRATIEVSRIEDTRAASRREVVRRARELLSTAFDETVLSSDELLDRVRESIRIEDITEYEGYPAGPRVADGDAIIVVEGRSDVLQLLKYGIKNAVAVEGTNVPEAVAELTKERTTTAFLDGDRGGELIMKELEQVGEIDSVAFAPAGRSVEELSREEVFNALREKVSYEALSETGTRRFVAATDGSARPAPDGESAIETTETTKSPETPAEPTDPDADVSPDDGNRTEASEEPASLREHAEATIGKGTGTVRVLDGEFHEMASAPAEDAFETIREAEEPPYALVIDGELSQRVLDIAAQRGVSQVITRERGQYTKRPTSVRIRTFEELVGPA